MNLINLSLYAEGYYSGSTYEENRWVKADSFEKSKIIYQKKSIVENWTENIVKSMVI